MRHGKRQRLAGQYSSGGNFFGRIPEEVAFSTAQISSKNQVGWGGARTKESDKDFRLTWKNLVVGDEKINVDEAIVFWQSTSRSLRFM